MTDTMVTLIRLNPHLDFVYTQSADDRSFRLDTRELRGVLDEVPLDTPDVLNWISDYLKQGLAPLNSQA